MPRCNELMLTRMAKTEEIMFHCNKNVKDKIAPPIPLKQGLFADEKLMERRQTHVYNLFI